MLLFLQDVMSTPITTSQYLDIACACLLGNIIHILYKAVSLRNDNKAQGKPYSFWQYIIDDRLPIIFDLACSFAIAYLAEEWLGDIGNYAMGKLKSLFFFVGFFASYILLQGLSKAKKNFRSTIKEQTKELKDLKEQ